MSPRFHAHEAALEWATALRPLIDRIARHDADLARQIRRAVASVVLNLAEGSRRAGRDRFHHYRISAGSAAEAQSGLGLGLAWGYLEVVDLEAVEAQRDRLAALLWRITHPRR